MLIVTSGAVLVTLVTVGISRLERAVPTVDRRTLWLGTVKRGSMLRQVRGVGSLVSEDILWVPAGVQGRVSRIFFEPGSPVGPNTVIVELTNPELELELLDARSQLSSAEAKLRAKKATLQDQFLSMEADLAQIQADQKEAKLKAEVDQKQFEDDLISELQWTLSKARVDELEKLLEIKQKRVEMFRSQTEPAQLAEMEAALRQVESLHRLKQNQIDSLQVRAGTDGVLAQVKEKIEPGQSVAAGTILAKITNPKQLRARLRIPEAQAQDVRIGLPAEVDTHHGMVSGKVSRIDPTVMEGNVTIDVSFDDPLPKGARPELSVVGTIEIEHLEDVLFVDRPVFASSGGVSELFKVVDGGKPAVRTRVRFGRSSVSTVEVLEGLEVGDEIILSDMSEWDGHEQLRLR